MPETQVQLTPDDLELLQHLAAELDASESEIIRRALESYAYEMLIWEKTQNDT